MNIFLTGATGYIGGSLAARLLAAGYSVRGLVRDPVKAKLLALRGIEPVLGSLEDSVLLRGEAHRADAVINAADADHRPSLQAMVDALAGSGKSLLHTSGSSLIGDDARGNRLSEAIFDEETPFVVEPRKQARHELNGMLLAAAKRNVRAIVVCPSLIYGVGKGLNPNSIQVPFLVEQARKDKVVRVVGRGLNRWSTVHIEDLEDLYILALKSGPAGAFYFAESGEASFSEIGGAIAQRLDLGAVESWARKMPLRNGGLQGRTTPSAATVVSGRSVLGASWVGRRSITQC